MSNKTYSEVARNIDEKSKILAKGSAADQGCYVDISRNIAVCMDSKELSKALKDFDQDVSWSVFLPHYSSYVQDMDQDTGLVNSGMYRREAMYFTAKKQYEVARKNLALGEEVCF